MTGNAWQRVLRDWNDDTRIEQKHSCGAVVVAVAEISTFARRRYATQTSSYRKAITALDRYAGTVCPRRGKLDRLRVGMTDATVAAVAGMPRTPRLRCWLYPVTRSHDGRRVCFVDGRATVVQVSVHG